MKKLNLFFVVLLLLVQWLPAGKIVPLPDIYNPRYIFASQDYFYIVEGITIHVYSSKDFKHLKKFGKEGEGPQEFRGGINGIYFSGGQMIVSSTGRASYFTLDGKFIKEKNVVSSMGWDFMPMGNHFAARGFSRDEKTRYRTFNLFDANLKKIKEFYRKALPAQEGKGIRVFTLSGFTLTHDDKLFIAFEKGFVLDGYNENGEKIFSIKRDDYPLVEVTGKHKEAVYYYYKTHPRTRDRFELIKQNLKFPGYLSAIRDFYAADKKIYIRTYRQVNDKTAVFIYDTNGKFIKKVFLRFIEADGFEYGAFRYTINRGKLLQLVENEDSEECELHISEIK